MGIDFGTSGARSTVITREGPRVVAAVEANS